MFDKQKKLIAGLLVLVLGALAFYFLYWTKTPEYSLNLVREAVKNHNTEQFERHVDLDSLLNKGYDDFIAYYLKTEGKDLGGFQTLAAGAAQMMKPSLVASLKSEILKSVSEVKEANTPTDTGKQDKTKQQVAVLNDNASKIYNKNVEVKGIKTDSQEPGVSIATIALHNKELEKDFDIKLKMNKLENGQWRVKEITNLIPLLDAIKEAELEKARKIDATVKENIYKNINGYWTEAGVRQTGNWIPSYTFYMNVDLKNLTDKEIKNIKICTKMFDPNGDYVRTLMFDNIESIGPQAQYTAKAEVKLNEFDSTDKKTISQDVKKCYFQLYVLSIETADGTKLERPKEASTGEIYPDAGKKVKKWVDEQKKKTQNTNKE